MPWGEGGVKVGASGVRACMLIEKEYTGSGGHNCIGGENSLSAIIADNCNGRVFTVYMYVDVFFFFFCKEPVSILN